MKQRALTLAGVALATLVLPGIAAAATATTSADLNMRAGPSTSFPVVEVVPDNAALTLHGCIDGYSWCDVTWDGVRGWVSANYLETYWESNYRPVIVYGARADIPIVTFAVDTYWDSYYRERPWYGKRSYWRGYWRDNRRDIRAERFEGRQEDRADRARDRRDDRADRRQDRRDDRLGDRKEKRDANKAERRENRADRRQEQRREKRSERRRSSERSAERQASNAGYPASKPRSREGYFVDTARWFAEPEGRC